jgi:hypothetical protein
LEVAFSSIVVARKGNLGYLFLELLQDLLVGDIALLIILMDDQAPFVADAFSTFWHERRTCAVFSTDIAVNALPAWVAVTGCTVAWRPVVAECQRPAQRI